MTKQQKTKPLSSGSSKEMDDNIDDLGHTPDGSKQEQPGTDAAKKRIKEDAAEAEGTKMTQAMLTRRR